MEERESVRQENLYAVNRAPSACSPFTVYGLPSTGTVRRQLHIRGGSWSLPLDEPLMRTHRHSSGEILSFAQYRFLLQRPDGADYPV